MVLYFERIFMASQFINPNFLTPISISLLHKKPQGAIQQSSEPFHLQVASLFIESLCSAVLVGPSLSAFLGPQVSLRSGLVRSD